MYSHADRRELRAPRSFHFVLETIAGPERPRQDSRVVQDVNIPTVMLCIANGEDVPP